MEQGSIGVLDYCAFGELNRISRAREFLQRVRMQYLPLTVASKPSPDPAKPN